jgi:hypothetical protein
VDKLCLYKNEFFVLWRNIMPRGDPLGRKHIKPGQLRRVGGIVMLSMAVGILVSWVFPGFSILAAIGLLVCGFYFLFM